MIKASYSNYTKCGTHLMYFLSIYKYSEYKMSHI